MNENLPVLGMESEEKNGLTQRVRKLWLVVAAMGALAMSSGTAEAQQTQEGTDVKNKISHLEHEIGVQYISQALEKLPASPDEANEDTQKAVDHIEQMTKELNNNGLVSESLPKEFLTAGSLPEEQQLAILQKSVDETHLHEMMPKFVAELGNIPFGKDVQEHLDKMGNELSSTGAIAESLKELPKNLDTLPIDEQIIHLEKRVAWLQHEFMILAVDDREGSGVASAESADFVKKIEDLDVKLDTVSKAHKEYSPQEQE